LNRAWTEACDCRRRPATIAAAITTSFKQSFDIETAMNQRMTRSPSLRPKVRVHPVQWCALIAVMIYLVSPWMDALVIERGDTTSGYPGWTLLFFGWMGLFSVLDGDPSAIGWLANPLFLVGTIAILIGLRLVAIIAMSAALSFALASFLLRKILVDEAGNTAAVVGHDIGFWIWLSSIGVGLLIAVSIQFLPGRPTSAPATRDPSATEIPLDAFQ